MKRWLVIPALAGLLITAGCGSEQAAVPGDSSNPSASTNAPAEGGASGSTEPAASSESTAKPATEKIPAGPWAKLEQSKYKTTDSGLTYAIIKEGKGAVAAAGQDVAMHYTGWLKSNGEKFDSSLDRGDPFHFSLGTGQVIPGWDEGVAGMKVGEKRQLVIPSKLGYGGTGTPGGPIPPDADLIFDVELLDVHAAH